MKRILSILFILSLLCCMTAIPASAAEGDSITVYNWGQYISDGTDGYLDVIAAFEEATGIEVNYVTYESNEALYTKLKTGGVSVDVIIPSDYMVGRLIQEDMLLKLDYSNIPNYQYIDEDFRNTDYDPNNEYSVPYTWGTVGLIYNTKYVSKEDAKSWTALWDADYSGKILMFNNCRDAFAIAEYLEGYSINTEDHTQLEDCRDLLLEQKPYVQQYVMDQIYDKMIREEAWLAPYYAGDYLMMAVDNEDLAFAFPEEGFNIFIDAMCVPSSAQNKAGAEAFINFLCDPEISGQNLEYLGYSTPLSEAKNYMDPEVAADPIAYPDSETLERATSFTSLSTAATQEMDALWLDVKTSGDDTTLMLILAVLLILGVAILWFYVRSKRRKRMRHRHRSGK